MDLEKPTDELIFFVNGKKVIEKNADPRMTLLTYLRRKLGLPGTKLGCGEGGCGACTVMVSRYNRFKGKIEHCSVNACLAPICSLHQAAVTTVEGIGSTKTRLHPIQECIAKSHGSQCGFCTPGIVMSMYCLLRNNQEPSTEEIENAFQGNLCRCTGYRPILQGFKTFAKGGCCGKKMQNGCRANCVNQDEGQGGCCGKKAENGFCMNSKDDHEQMPSTHFDSPAFKPLDPTQETIFPPELLLHKSKPLRQVCFKGDGVTWFQPSNLRELLALRSSYPEAKLVVGNTEVGIEIKFKNMRYPVIIAPGLIEELNAIKHTQEGICFGAACSLTTMGDVLRKAVAELPPYKTEVFKAVLEQLRWFAGEQIRNVAAVGGNIMTASPISDLNPVFMASSSKLHLISQESRRTVHMDGNFFTGYRKTIVKPQEILLSIEIPYSKKWEYLSTFKQATRREDDIAIVTGGMRVLFEAENDRVQEIQLSYGGMAPITVLAQNTCKELVGREWNESLLQDACHSLAKEMTLTPSAPGGMVEFRQTLTLSFFFKFYLTVLKKLALDLKSSNNIEKIPPKYESATELFHQSYPSGVQLFQDVPEGQAAEDYVGRPLMHLSALKQAAGEAVYCDDIPRYENELYLGLIMSTKAHAKIISIDTTEAECTPGFVCFLFAKDIPGNNITGIRHDEDIFADGLVTCVGQVVGGVVADTQEHAQRAAKMVKISYEDLPAVITIQEAIEKKSFYLPIKKMENGDLWRGFQEADHIHEGEIYIGGQEHFYLETNCAIAVPKEEDGAMEMYVSTQNTTKTQSFAAEALGVPSSRIVVRVKRMGGGFGGKESRSTVVSTAVAIAAHKTGRPVRCMLDRDEDMLITGGRHPYLGRYKVGFTKSGKVTALEVSYYSNSGNTLDLSESVMDRTLFHMTNAYKIPNIQGTGYLCKTNIPSNTAFRGFGGPQGMLVAECWIDDIAQICKLPPEQVRRLNLYEEGDLTHFNQKLEGFTLPRCWDECLKNSNYHERRLSIEEFNRQHRWKKRGMAIIPTKFGISFTLTLLNQAGALVHIYTDGSVLLTHGGTEMGQGLHTKMIQVASKALKIPTSKMFISETSTNTVPNTSPTAASASSDLNGMAIFNACQKLLKRLEPYKQSNPTGTWENWVLAAYVDRVSLSASGFYKTPGIGYDPVKNEGNPTNYFSYGVACSEVEIDCLTGDHKNLRTDIVMDVGTSLNPAIDVGQIEGAFVQGVGLFTLEEMKYSPDGFLYTRGPGMYKIPAFGDIPTEFNVSLLRDCPNEKAIYSSKAVGEPPLFLSASVFYAIKDAITSARLESGVTGMFRLDSPATPERIRNACIDNFTKLCAFAEPGTFKPWAVQV